MSHLKLQVGKYYRAHDESIVYIISMINETTEVYQQGFRFVSGGSGQYYTETGLSYVDGSTGNPSDLIEEVKITQQPLTQKNFLSSDGMDRARVLAAHALDKEFGLGKDTVHRLLRIDATLKRVYECALAALSKEIYLNNKVVYLSDDTKPTVSFKYTNYKNETAIRQAIPMYVRWGITEWHPTPGYLLTIEELKERLNHTNLFRLAKRILVTIPDVLKSFRKEHIEDLRIRLVSDLTNFTYWISLQSIYTNDEHDFFLSLKTRYTRSEKENQFANHIGNITYAFERLDRYVKELDFNPLDFEHEYLLIRHFVKSMIEEREMKMFRATIHNADEWFVLDYVFYKRRAGFQWKIFSLRINLACLIEDKLLIS